MAVPHIDPVHNKVFSTWILSAWFCLALSQTLRPPWNVKHITLNIYEQFWYVMWFMVTT